LRYSKNNKEKTDELIFAGSAEFWACSYCENTDNVNVFSPKASLPDNKS